MSDSTSKRDVKLQESVWSVQIVLVVTSVSAAVVFLFGMAFRP
jgi:hypothetical protein